MQALLLERGADPGALDIWGVRACEAAGAKDRAGCGSCPSTPLPLPLPVVESSPAAVITAHD